MVLHEIENLLEQKKQQEEGTTYKWEKCFIQQGLIYIIYKKHKQHNKHKTKAKRKQKTKQIK